MSENPISEERRLSGQKVPRRVDRWKVFYRVTFTLSVAALVGSFWLGYYGYSHPSDLKGRAMNEWPLHAKLQAVVLMAWLVIPPIFFWFEYFGIYRPRQGYKSGDAPPADWEMFKYAQDISAKIWLAISTTLLILYFGKDIKL